jgi:N-acetylneuraminate lyase
MFRKLEGLLPAFITAFDEGGKVMAGAAEKLVKYYQFEGADGLYALGWTGEGWCMNVDERKEWAAATLAAAKGKLPVVIHVGYCEDTNDAAALAKHAAERGAYAVASVPLKGNNSLGANAEYFRKVHDAAGLPFYIYWNQELIDDATGKRASAPKLLEVMRKNPGFVGIKYTDTNFYYVDRLKKYDPTVNILTGADGMCIAGGLLGSDGSIGALQAMTCKHMKTMWVQFKAGAIEEAVALQNRANNIYEAIDRPEVGVIQGIKAVLGRMGLPAGVAKGERKTVGDKRELRRLFEIYDGSILK